MRSDIEVREIEPVAQAVNRNALAPRGPGPWEVASRSNNQVYYNPPSSNPIEAESQSRTWLRQNDHNEADFEVRTREGAGNADTAQAGQFREPDANRGDLTPRGPGPWEIYRISDSSSVRNLTHTDRQMAGQEARMALGMRGEAPELYGVRTRQSDAAQGGLIDVASGTEWDVVNLTTGQTIGRVTAADQRSAENAMGPVITQFNTTTGNDEDDDYGVRPATQSAPQTLTRPGQGQQQFTGTWLVLDPNGRELHRFSGIGNVQADANRIAINWLRAHPGAMQAGVTVAPEMA
jgi:hypothetical protein